MAARSECLGPPIPSAPDRGFFVRVIPGRNSTIPRTIKARSPHYLYVERIYSAGKLWSGFHEQCIRTRNAPGHLERTGATTSGLEIWGGLGPSLGTSRHRVGAIAPATAGRDAQSPGGGEGRRVLSRPPRRTRSATEDPQLRKEERPTNPPSRSPHQAAAPTKNVRND